MYGQNSSRSESGIVIGTVNKKPLIYHTQMMHALQQMSKMRHELYGVRFRTSIKTC